MLKILNKIQVVLYDIFNNLAAIVLTVILCTVTAGIVSRYIFNNPFMWTEELCTILMVYLAFLAAPLATIAQEHIVADFFKTLIPARFSRVLSFVIRLFEIAFFVILARSCILYIPGRTFRTATLGIPRIVYYIPVLAGTLVMIYSLCVHLLNDLFPGFDYFKQRQEKREEEIKRQEKAEEQEMINRMDTFMDDVEKTQKEEQL